MSIKEKLREENGKVKVQVKLKKEDNNGNKIIE